MNPLTCLACGHVDPKHDASDLAGGIFACGECGARMAYGKLVPRIVVEPFVDEQGHLWIRRRIQDPKTKADLFVFDMDVALAGYDARASLALVLP